jgi:hypothetical protein
VARYHRRHVLPKGVDRKKRMAPGQSHWQGSDLGPASTLKERTAPLKPRATGNHGTEEDRLAGVPGMPNASATNPWL